LKISNEFKVAITILAAILVGFLGYRVMSDLPLFRNSMVIHTYFSRTDGLSPGNYVYINGVKVGSVKRMELTSGDSVEVTMSFDLGLELPTNSVAHVESSGLLDEKAVVVKRGDSPKNLQYGDYMKGIYNGGMLETLKTEGRQLSEDVSESFGKLNTLLAQLNTMLNDTTKNRVDSVLQNLNTTSDNISKIFKNRRSEIESSLSHAQQILANVDTVSMTNKSRVDSVMDGLDQSLDELQKLSHDLNETNAQLNQILTKINNGQGSLGKMVNDPALYNNLKSLSGEMDTLIKNINKNPRKYLKHMSLIQVF